MISTTLLLITVTLVTMPAMVFAQNPVAYWPFDSNEDVRAEDVSGYDNHGELVGSVAFGEGVLGQGISLDGSGQHVEVPADASLDDLEAFTFAAWVKTLDDSNQVIVAKDTRNAFVKIGAFGNYLKGCVRAGTFICSVSFDDAAVIDQWTFVVMTYDGEGDRMVHLYANGEELSYRSQSAAGEGRARNSDAGAPLAIGSIPESGSQPFNGEVDEVRVYATALSTAEVRALYEQDLGAPRADVAPPLVSVTDPVGDFVQTEDATIDLAGTAVDASGIVDVSWSTQQGEFGSAVGGASWTVADVPLHPDENVISVAARDAAGNVGSRSLRVLRREEGAPDAFEGFGAGTTGGAGHPEYVAASPAQFAAVLGEVNDQGGNAQITLAGSWEYDAKVRLAHVQNVTLNGTGADVTFRDTTLLVMCSENVVLQGLRVRNNQVGDDAIQINSSERVVIDHNSASGAGDGNIDITGWSCGPSRYITVSWNIFSDTWKQSLIKYGGTTKVSLHHNLFYNSGNRLPAMQAAEGEFDVRNNIFYQWGSSGTSLQFGVTANLIGNIYEPGSPGRGHAAIWYQDETSKAWIADNLLPSTEKDVSRLTQPISVPDTTTHAPSIARLLILDGAGAWPRDQYDADVTATVVSGTFPALPPFHD